MEWWSYASDGKGLVYDESVSAGDAIARGKNGSMSWDFKTPFTSGSNLVCPSQEGIANQGFMGFSFPHIMRKPVFHTSNGDDLGMKIGGDQVVFNPITANQNAFSEEEESSSKISSSVVESNSRDSGLIDLKLGRFGDQRDVHSNPNSGSAESSVVHAKRMRVVGLGSQTPFCQVFGCKKNLSSCKDYHKRHKVCEVHSKTAKVIVKGLEQRFCQQCSRFHLLTEFDDGKRSCRKRLAGHNERRRKPHVGGHNRPGRLFSAYNCTLEGSAGSRFKGTTAEQSSYISQGILPNGIHYPQKYGANEWARHIKLEDGTSYDPQSTVSVTDGKLHSTALQPFGCKSYYPPLHEFETNSTMQSKSDGNTKYSQNSRFLNVVSPSFFPSSSIGDREEDFAIFDSASAVGIASDTALSLLSSQSLNSSSSSRIPMAHPLLIPGSQNAHHRGTEVSENLMVVGPRASVTGVSNNCHSSCISSMEETHLDPLLISEDSNAATFGLEGLFQGSEFNNRKDQFCSEDGSTIDLLQLSSQLQRVEHQREGLHVKPEDDTFFGLSIY